MNNWRRGNKDLMRALNRNLLLNIVRSQGPLSRTQLTELSGLSVGAVSQIINDLLEDDLIDIITGGGYFHIEPWENLVALGHKYGVPVYACLSGSRVVSASNPEGGRPDMMPLWHGEAALAWQADVDGIYTFNVFNPRDELFRTLGSPDTLMRLDMPHKPITGEKKTMERWLKGGSSFLTLPEP